MGKKSQQISIFGAACNKLLHLNFPIRIIIHIPEDPLRHLLCGFILSHFLPESHDLENQVEYLLHLHQLYGTITIHIIHSEVKVQDDQILFS